MIDLLAAVPSLIYGLWGLFYLQPRLITLSKWMADHMGWVPFFHVDDQYGTSLGIFPSSTFVSGVIVSLMVIPICTAVMREVFSQAPPGEREGAMALGGTRWGVVRDVVLPFGRGGIIGGSMLGLGRALGETMAITFVIGNAHKLSWSLFAAGNSIASTLANEFAEADSTLHISSLFALGLILFVITFIVLAAAKVMLSRMSQGEGSK
jgi:phosphate transport system permease protein